MATSKAEQLKQVRLRYALTQTQLAKLIFSTRRTVQSWENGSRNMPESKWQLLLITLQPKEPKNDPPIDKPADKVDPAGNLPSSRKSNKPKS